MNQQDKTLITQLATDLKSMQPVKKDSDADHLIKQEFNQSDMTYQMVQAILIQQKAIEQLQQQVNVSDTQPKGFFGNLFNKPANTTNTATQGFGHNSFLGSALSTVAGVAGGMFLFNGISHLFSGSNAPIDTAQNMPTDDSLMTNDGLFLDQGFGADNNSDLSGDMGSDMGTDDFSGGNDFDGDFGDF